MAKSKKKEGKEGKDSKKAKKPEPKTEEVKTPGSYFNRPAE